MSRGRACCAASTSGKRAPGGQSDSRARPAQWITAGFKGTANALRLARSVYMQQRPPACSVSSPLDELQWDTVQNKQPRFRFNS